MNFRLTASFCVASVLTLALTPGPALAKDAAQTTSPVTEAAPPNSRVVEDIVARVNDRIISNSDYQRAEHELEAEATREGLSEDQLDARKKNLLRDLIDQQLLLSKGKQLDISGETGMIKRLDEIRKANHLDSMDALEKAAEAQHVSFEDFKASIRNSVITQQVVRQEVSQHVAISPQEERAYYKEHESDFSNPESIQMSEILIPTPEDADAAQLDAAKTKAEDAETKLKNGADFAKLAKEISGGPTAAQGGALGQFRRGMMAPQLEAKTFALQAGQYTEPIRTKQGYVILKVTAHTPGGLESFDKVRPQVEEAIFMEKMQPALRKYLTKLREQAYVDVQPGFTDSGASDNEIQMTYSAYAPPGKKEKKKFHRTRFRGRHAEAEQVESSEAATATATAPNSQPSKDHVRVKGHARAKAKYEQKPGKKEKIRFGQAPRESLPPASEDVNSPAPVTASVNPDVHYIKPGGEIAPQQAEEEKPEEKTRFGSRGGWRHDKKEKAKKKPLVPPPTAAEVQTQSVQDQPYGLGDKVVSNNKKKEKKKGKEEKTRFSERPSKPEEVQQPYMGNQQPVPPASSQPAQPQSGPPASKQ